MDSAEKLYNMKKRVFCLGKAAKYESEVKQEVKRFLKLVPRFV